MAREAAIIELAQWLRSPPGRYLVQWEQPQFDRAVSDVFGFHALQLGLPQIDALRANRMPHRWVAADTLQWPEPIELPEVDEGLVTLAPQDPIALHCDFDALPMPNQSLDLVVMPHTLELATDPHLTLREVERVLMPEGRVVITGFNPASLWGLRQRTSHLRRRLGLGGRLFLPSEGEFIGYWRLRDWLRLLGFEIEGALQGCWRPPLANQRWLDSWAWIDGAGARWWPVFGAVYVLVAVKRVRGMRLIGVARRQLAGKAKPASAVVANSHCDMTQR
jgi:SAM-dependent methyltransferase